MMFKTMQSISSTILLLLFLQATTTTKTTVSLLQLSMADAFTVTTSIPLTTRKSTRTISSSSTVLMAAESEVSFDTLDGSKMRIGIIKGRWNKEHIDNLVTGIKTALTDCQVEDQNIFETSVPGSFELPLAARFLALSGTVDAIICVGVLIKGETMHFEYISDAVAKGIMNIGIQTSTPIVFGVLTCLNEKQVVARSTGTTNHGYDWGKTAVEMALLRTEAMGGKASDTPLKELGFGLVADSKKDEKEKVPAAKPGFF